ENKLVVVVGATGTGKSRLSIDLASYFGAAEVINSDKVQIYRGLDITTNKITEGESRGVPHHLLGVADPFSEFTAGNFRAVAEASVKSVLTRGNLPLIAGGSNSYIEALIDPGFRSRYECCFLWVDVAMPELHTSLSERVDRMIGNGMIEEVQKFYQKNGDYSRGILKSIGVPELHGFFRSDDDAGEEARMKLLSEGIDAVKLNTSRLACRQLRKILRFRTAGGWRLHRLDATDAFKARAAAEAEAAWERNVVAPAVSVVTRFL
ncbi:hypothetical protein M569_15242, partial [Genlisea aurea]